MKNAVLCLLSSVLLLAGCESTQVIPGDQAAAVRNFVSDIEPGLRPAAALSCSLYLAYGVDPSGRAALSKDLWVVASIVQAATPNQSPGDLSKAIQAALGSSDAESKALADGIAGVWAIALPFIKGDPALLLKVTGDIAAGVAQVAGS